MSPEQRKQRIEELAERAAMMPTAERRAWLERECDGDAELLDEARYRLTRRTRRAGPWRLVSELGHGRQSTVYLAVREDGERKERVAVKLVRAGHATPQVLAAFERERATLLSLEHPAIAQLHDAGESEAGQAYFVSEIVDGEPITVYARRHRLSTDQILLLYLEACRAVSYAHNKLVAHGDLKPGHIVVGEDGQLKVLDFGISSTTTLAYASLEQINAAPPSPESDVYSLAAVLYELLAGQPPLFFEHQLRLPSEMADGAKRVSALKGLLDNTLVRALARNPDDRHQSADEFALDLARVVEREQGIEIESFIRGGTPEISRRALAGFGAAALSGGVSLAGWLWLNGRQPGVQPDVETMPTYLQAAQLLTGDPGGALAMFEGLARQYTRSAPLQARLAEAQVLVAERDDPAQFAVHMRQAEAAARLGLTLDARREDLHHWLGVALLFGSWEPAKALECLDQAVRLNPRHSASHRLRADIHCMFGRFDRALAVLDEAPADAALDGEKAAVYFRWRRFAQAEKSARRALNATPGDTMSRLVLGLDAGRPLSRWHHERPGPSARALTLASRGNKGGALKLLEEAYEQRDADLLYVSMDPRYDSLRGEPRFVKLLQQIGLPAVAR